MDMQYSKLERTVQDHCGDSSNICEELDTFLNVVLHFFEDSLPVWIFWIHRKHKIKAGHWIHG